MGCIAGKGSRKCACQTHGRNRRRRISKIRRRTWRLCPQAFLGRRPAAARDGQTLVGRAAQEVDTRRPRLGQGL